MALNKFQLSMCSTMAEKAPYSIRGYFNRIVDVREDAERERILAARRERARQKRERAQMAAHDKPGIQKRIAKQVKDAAHGQKLVNKAAKKGRRAEVVARKVAHARYESAGRLVPNKRGGKRKT
jgi:hypothetical protein